MDNWSMVVVMLQNPKQMECLVYARHKVIKNKTHMEFQVDLPLVNLENWCLYGYLCWILYSSYYVSFLATPNVSSLFSLGINKMGFFCDVYVNLMLSHNEFCALKPNFLIKYYI